MLGSVHRESNLVTVQQDATVLCTYILTVSATKVISISYTPDIR